MIAVFITYVSAFMIRRYGVSMAVLAWILTAITAGNLFGNLAGGFLMGRSWRYAGLVAVLLIEGAALAWKFAAEPALPAAMAAGLLFSFLTGMSRSTLVDTLSNFAPQDRGTIIGVFATSNQVGFVLGASLGGLAIAWGGYGALGAICLAAGAGGEAFYLRLCSRVSAIR
jgi:predicted MFS family arabinose efflux permease